ncbi:MAG: signal peptidase I [Candidatus Pacebacteria bacterium]|nr:signal peptidase I [Candidatus Paceibacterota bacterium]
MNKILKNMVEVALYVAIIVALAVGTPKALVYVMGTEYPVASITSGSMWPVLKKGDMVLIRSVDRSQLAVGDIIVYKNSDALVGDNTGFTIHRIVEMNENNLVTKGDANNIKDAAITYDKIVGRTVNFNSKPVRIPQIGKLTIWISEMK